MINVSFTAYNGLLGSYINPYSVDSSAEMVSFGFFHENVPEVEPPVNT